MESMGQSRTSEVQRDARIGEAECNRQVFDDYVDLLMIVMNMDMNITVIIKIILILMTTVRTRTKCPGTA